MIPLEGSVAVKKIKKWRIAPFGIFVTAFRLIVSGRPHRAGRGVGCPMFALSFSLFSPVDQEGEYNHCQDTGYDADQRCCIHRIILLSSKLQSAAIST
jgi:hypothetical protein